jgi:hypothetical protein
MTYTWDAENRMASYAQANSDFTNVYNADGLRVQRDGTGSLTRTIRATTRVSRSRSS